MAVIKLIEKYFNILNHILITINAIFIINLTWKQHFQGTSLHVLLVTIGVCNLWLFSVVLNELRETKCQQDQQ